jgi:hypothetical protein
VALSFLYIAFVRLLQLVRLSWSEQQDLAIEVTPPDDDVVEHGCVGFVEQVLILCTARPDPAEVVGQARLEQRQGAPTFDAHGAEVARVEDRGVVPAGEVFGDRALRIRQRHLPAAKIYKSGAEVDVLGVQWGMPDCHPANLAKRGETKDELDGQGR